MTQDDPEIGRDARDDVTAAKVVSDTNRPARFGVGGPGGASAVSDPLDQSERGGGGASPSSPIDLENPRPEGSSAVIGHEAAQRASGDAPEESPGSI